MPEIIDYTKVGGTFRDTGEGDVDFYTYWYSVCYVTGMLNQYRHIFRDIDVYEQMVRRFLQSRGIAIKNDDDLSVLQYIYNNWEDDVEKRGTWLINDFKSKSAEIGRSNYSDTGVVTHDIAVNSGIGILSNLNALIGAFSPTLQLGYMHVIEFDALFVDEDGVQYTVGGAEGGGLLYNNYNGIYITKLAIANPDNIASYRFTYHLNAIDYSFTTNINVTTLNHIKFVRRDTKVYLYINDVLIGSLTTPQYIVYTANYLFQSNLPAIANIVVHDKDINFDTTDVFSWVCHEGSGYVVESNRAPNYSAQLIINPTLSWDTVWRRSELFANTGYVGVDGELRRLLGYIDGECLFELIASGEMGLGIDMSSPISEEASCKNLNKAYERGTVTELSKYPLTFNSAVHPDVKSGYIENVIPAHTSGWFGINAPFIDLTIGQSYLDLSNVKPNGLIPFIPIPVATDDDNLDGYEISFVINSNANIQLSFGIITFDSTFGRLTLKTKSYVSNATSDWFLQSSDFRWCKNQDLWIRGVYSLSKLTDVDTKLNINQGNNLYNFTQNSVKYIVPVIIFKAVVDVDVIVKIKDIVIRPLSLSTSKGIVCNKNVIAGYLRNDSGQSQEVVDEFINQKLIPYNCVTNIQHL